MSDEQTEILREILKWIRFMGSSQVKSVLISTLDNDKKRLAYHLSDGNNTTRIIGEQVEVDPATISDWWKQWILLGIGEGVAVKGGGNRFKRSFDLKALGITLPAIKVKKAGLAATPQEATQGGETIAQQ